MEIIKIQDNHFVFSEAEGKWLPCTLRMSHIRRRVQEDKAVYYREVEAVCPCCRKQIAKATKVVKRIPLSEDRYNNSWEDVQL